MKVLITGGAGFVGYHLAHFHAGRGDIVYIVDSFFKANSKADEEFTKLSEHPNVYMFRLDLLHTLNTLNIPAHLDVVYHLAAINGTQLFYEIPYQVARTNLLITMNLLDWLNGQSVGKLVYSSTSEVYAGGEEVGLLQIPTDETAPVVFPQPTNIRFSYGTSKFMGEFLCFQFGRTFRVPTSVIRYHNIYGARMGTRHVIPEFIARLQAKENPFKIYGSQETRAFCYIDDAVMATYKVATTDACNDEIIHIGNPTETTIEDLAFEMMDIYGGRVPLQELKGRASSVSRRCPDTTKLKNMTGFEAQVPLREGLARTMDWYIARSTMPTDILGE